MNFKHLMVAGAILIPSMANAATTLKSNAILGEWSAETQTDVVSIPGALARRIGRRTAR
jgi:hypothetical protein